MDNNLTFTIEKVFGAEQKLKGYFVSKSNKVPSPNLMMEVFSSMAEAMGESVGEGYKKQVKEPEKLLCTTPKEIQDFITYHLGEFTEEVKS